jgi:phenolic acid decarboxylase
MKTFQVCVVEMPLNRFIGKLYIYIYKFGYKYFIHLTYSNAQCSFFNTTAIY